MALSSTRGGGFLIGVIYGLIVSTALSLVLSYLFPIKPDQTPAATAIAQESAAPVVMETMADAANLNGAAPEPASPDITVPQMAQPDAGANEAVSLGSANDSVPAAPVATAQIAGNQAVNEPGVSTESAAVPDIGNGTRETVVPGADTTVPNTTQEAASSAPLTTPVELANSASGPAVEVFAVPFTGDTSKPLLAIILKDTLEGSLQPLVDAGIPITFAVPADIDQRESAQSIRESGFEVVALVPDDDPATSDDVAANVARYMQNVPVAVALMDSQNASLMLHRDSMEKVIEASKGAGLGLISYARNGELIARTQAESADMLFGSALSIADNFQDEELIVQALNQAAFVAGTKDRAIIFGKTTPATINAILRWLGSPRASQVELVPVSIVLQPRPQ